MIFDISFVYLEYYRIKTEEIREQAAEQKRKT